MLKTKQRVVVTGLGLVSSIGNNIKEFYSNLHSSRSGSNTITRFNCNEVKTKIGCEIKNLDLEKYFNPKQNATLDFPSKYGIISSREAILSSKLSPENLNSAGIIWGSATGGTLVNAANQVIQNIKNSTPLNAYFLSTAVTSAAPSNIAIANKIYGMNYAVSSTCSSASQAILNAVQTISFGLSNVMLAGGAEAPLSEVAFKAFEALDVLSKNNENPQEACRPFDYQRDGMLLGEGSASLVLEPLEHAEKRGAEIICEIAGGASTSDAFHLIAPNPEGTMISETMKQAAKKCFINLKDIDVVNLHGTATLRGDSAELSALVKTFGKDLSTCNFIATKSLTGHTLGASGAISAVISALSIKNNALPCSTNFTKTDDNFKENNFSLNKKMKPLKEIKNIMTNSFGFGGHNVSLIFKKFEK